jgi:hypothetical protein
MVCGWGMPCGAAYGGTGGGGGTGGIAAVSSGEGEVGSLTAGPFLLECSQSPSAVAAVSNAAAPLA